MPDRKSLRRFERIVPEICRFGNVTNPGAELCSGSWRITLRVGDNRDLIGD